MKAILMAIAGTLFTLLTLRATDAQKLKKATFAGGCFWCIEAPFEKVEGVVSAVSGYTGGDKADPTYREVSSGSTSHLEAVQITYDPQQISYQQLLEIYWRQFDPTDAGGSFYDRGHQYTSAIFYHDDRQKKLAEASKIALEKSGRFTKPIVTPIRPAQTFYPAEDYHQDYYKKEPQHYNRYRLGPRPIHRENLGEGKDGHDFKFSIQQATHRNPAPKADPSPVPHNPGRGDRTPLQKRVLEQQKSRHLRRYRLRRTPL